MILYFALSLGAFCSNGLTLIYILRSFDISVHVFALLFVDAFLSTFFSAISTFFDGLVLSNFLEEGNGYCFASFVAVYLPSYAGQVRFD